MRLARFTLATLAALTVTFCHADMYRRRSTSGMWYGKMVLVDFTNSTFTNQPTWNVVTANDPPLKPQDACKIATAHIAETKVDQLTYAIENISLIRYFDTDHWYYAIQFQSIDPIGSNLWHGQEPYRSLLAAGKYPQDTNAPPRLDVFILMNGVVADIEEM